MQCDLKSVIIVEVMHQLALHPRAYGARLSRRGLERRSLNLRDHLYGTRMLRARFYTDPLKTVTVHIIIFCFVSLSYYFTRSIAVLMTK